MKALVEQQAAAFKVNVLEDRPTSQKYRAFWTPTLVYASPDGTELSRWIGYLPPAEFAPQFLIGAGLARLQMKDVDGALACFDEAATRWSKAFAAPEAVYWRGVARYRKTKDAGEIGNAAREIFARYPDSLWATKLEFFKA